MSDTIKLFSKSILQQLAYNEAPDGYEVVLDELNDSSRWSLHYRMVFKYEDKYYATYYCRGATESQDERPYEYEGNEICCVQVAPVEVVKIEYLPMKVL